MLTGRLVQKLDKTIEYYQTPGCEDLLSEANLNMVMAHYKDGSGTYTDTFKDDLAIAVTKVTPANDAGRLMYDTDTIIVRLTRKDFGKLLELIMKEYGLFSRMLNYLLDKNNGELVNPLPEVKI
jgi:hypothetical protein